MPSLFNLVNAATVAGDKLHLQSIVASIVAVLFGMDTFSLVKYAAIALVFSGVPWYPPPAKVEKDVVAVEV